MLAAVIGLALMLFALPAIAAVVQQGTLRVSVTTQIKPYRLSRTDPTPIDVFIAGHIATTTGAVPSQLQRMTVLINRHGTLGTKGLPTCTLSQIQATTTARAVERCGDALVGSGHFWASVVLPEQPAYRTTGRLLAFNGVREGHPALFAQIYTSQPFPGSFVVPFSIRHINRGAYGEELTATLPQALGDWGFVNRIKMTLGREYRIGGQTLSYLNASCPAPGHAKTAAFPLALAKFSFADGQVLGATINKSCGVKR